MESRQTSHLLVGCLLKVFLLVTEMRRTSIRSILPTPSYSQKLTCKFSPSHKRHLRLLWIYSFENCICLHVRQCYFKFSGSGTVFSIIQNTVHSKILVLRFWGYCRFHISIIFKNLQQSGLLQHLKHFLYLEGSEYSKAPDCWTTVRNIEDSDQTQSREFVC